MLVGVSPFAAHLLLRTLGVASGTELAAYFVALRYAFEDKNWCLAVVSLGPNPRPLRTAGYALRSFSFF